MVVISAQSFGETLEGRGDDRLRGRDETKAETGGRKREKTGSGIRFSLVAALRFFFPYQQARGSRRI